MISSHWPLCLYMYRMSDVDYCHWKTHAEKVASRERKIILCAKLNRSLLLLSLNDASVQRMIIIIVYELLLAQWIKRRAVIVRRIHTKHK